MGRGRGRTGPIGRDTRGGEVLAPAAAVPISTGFVRGETFQVMDCGRGGASGRGLVQGATALKPEPEEDRSGPLGSLAPAFDGTARVTVSAAF